MFKFKENDPGLQLEEQKSYFLFFLSYGLVFSFPLSKPAMTFFSTLCGCYCIYIAALYIRKRSRFGAATKHALYFSLFYGLFGSVSFFVHPAPEDFFRFLIKNNFILSVPIFVYILSFNKHFYFLLITFIFSTVIASGYSLYDFFVVGQGDLSYRATGFLTHSRHLTCVLCGIAIILLTYGEGLTNQYSKRYPLLKYLLAGLLLLFVTSVIVSGTRGAWLALVVLFIIWSIFYKKIKFFFRALIIFAPIFLFVDYLNDNYLLNRTTSIASITKDQSNAQRISIWQGGLSFMVHNSSHDKTKFLWGSGIVSAEREYEAYIDELPLSDQKKYFYVNGSDFHNSFIDLSVKSGLIYSLILFLSFITTFFLCVKKISADIPAKIYILCMVPIFVMMPFYSLDYSAFTLAFVFSIALFSLNRKS